MMFLFVVAVLAAIVANTLLKSLLLFFRQYRLIKKLPGPPVIPVLGNAVEMLAPPTELPKIIGARVKEHGGLYRLWIFNEPYIVLSKAQYAEAFFNSKEVSMKADVYQFLHVWLGLGLLTSQGQLWHQRRKLITPAFHFAILNAFSETIIDNSLTLIGKLKEDPEGALVNVFKIMHLVALDNISETAMGIKIDALNNPQLEYIQAIEGATATLMDRMKKPWLWNDLTYYMLPVGRKLKKDLDLIMGLSTKVIKDKQNEKLLKKTANGISKKEEAEEKKKQAFLDLLIEACESESVPLSNKDLQDEVNTFMFEGHDTTAVGMSYALYLLGLHPEVQEKCYRELNEIFQGSDRRPTPEDLTRMKYLECVIRESLRLFPSVPLLCRQVSQDTKMGEFTLPEGSMALLNIFHLHRDPKCFPDPEKFDPDRFTTENTAHRHPFAFVPFAAGARNCIGQKFAMMEEKIVLSYILRNFCLESMGKLEDVEPCFTLILRCEKPLNVKLKAREKPVK